MLRSPLPCADQLGAPRASGLLYTANGADDRAATTTAARYDAGRRHDRHVHVRWVAVGILEAVKGFRRLKGCADMPKLVAALRARDQHLGLVIAEQKVA